MAISLKKGQKVDLTKTNPGLKEILVGLGWDTNRYDGGKDFDLDTSIFCSAQAAKSTAMMISFSMAISSMFPARWNILAIT